MTTTVSTPLFAQQYSEHIQAPTKPYSFTHTACSTNRHCMHCAGNRAAALALDSMTDGEDKALLQDFF